MNLVALLPKQAHGPTYVFPSLVSRHKKERWAYQYCALNSESKNN